MLGGNIAGPLSKHEASAQCWADVGPSSTMLGQHQANIWPTTILGQMYAIAPQLSGFFPVYIALLRKDDPAKPHYKISVRSMLVFSVCAMSLPETEVRFISVYFCQRLGLHFWFRHE